MAYSFSERRAARGSGYSSYTPPIPGTQTGNAGAVQPTPQQQFRSLLRPELQGDFDRFVLQGGDFKKYDINEALNRFNTQRTADQTFTANQPEPEVTTTPEKYNADRDLNNLIRELISPESQQQRAQSAFDLQKQLMDYGQEKGKESAKLAFQYEMMGRIPDTIANALAGSGQLMREGAKDISNTVMRGVEALPKPNIQARTYQNPTFRYFQ
jgi:hypothetical protein|tara:strand:+ start:175 stop:810 length:636 start_codon:yes stop_codon:yes gene_type:complete